VYSTISRAISLSGARSSGFKARNVPPASAAAGMTFSADPARTQPTLKTAAWVGSNRRLTRDWSATVAWESARMGS
jgi:hypothetical protein